MKINTKPRNQKLVKKIGLRISILRNVRGMSRLKLAEAAQISVRKIREYESGNKAMTIDELATI